MNPRQLTLTAAALLVSAAGANAATVTHTVTVGPSLKAPISTTITFAPFNTALGTLTSVVDTITEVFTDTFGVTDGLSVSSSGSAVFSDTFSKSFESGALALSGLVTSGTTLSLGPSGSTTGSITGTASISSAAVALAAFTGTAAVSATVGATANFGASGFGVVTQANAATATVVDKLEYIYTPVSPPSTIPEPATLTLLGSGLVGLGLGRMRRRRRR